ncbi:MAG: MBL fold metallo-hydrolase [Dehalococcoidia bacterium]
MEIQILGAHNCESRDTRLVSLVIDQTLAIDAGSLTSSLSMAEQQHLKAVFITHHHFDHIRDLATLGMNIYPGGTIELYALDSALSALCEHLFTEEIYLDFGKRPSPERPTFKLCPLEPYKEVIIEGYALLPLPVSHSVPAVGYHITSHDNKCIFFSGDTGRNPSSLWQALSPQLLIIEVTMPNRFEMVATSAGHLCPRLLKEELGEFKKIRGYLPPIVTVHMSPHFEGEIREEVERISAELEAKITLGYEGMKILL